MAESPAAGASLPGAGGVPLPGATPGESSALGGAPPLSGLQAPLPPATSSSVWDPTASADWDRERASAQCVLRIKRDIMSIYKEPPPGMFVVPDPHDMTKVEGTL
ncbi:hypothetical protein FKM82_030466 [Ascaphus truei]